MLNTPFPVEKLETIKQSIDRALESGANPVAAFDADGTLWNTDVGLHFFNYQISNKLIPLPEDPWDYYDKLPTPGSYLWLAQVNKGISKNQFNTWSEAALKTFGEVPLFPAMQSLIKYLQLKNVKVFIVTASVQWAIEPAAKLYNIPVENVVGVKTKIIDGVITDEQDGSITYKEGKVLGLKERCGNETPFFCAGNTKGDLPLLESASHIKLVNVAEDTSGDNYESERAMLALAKERGWFFHDYQ